MSFCRERKNAASDHREQTEADHHVAGEVSLQCAVDQHLATQHRVERHVQQQSRQHGRDRCRSFCVGVRQPVMHRHQADLGAVAEKQKNKRQRQNVRFELGLDAAEIRPQQRAAGAAEYALRGEVEQDGSEQSLRDADTAKNEVFPCRFETRGSPVHADQQYRGQGRGFHRRPQDAKIIGHQGEQHGEVEQLVHAVIEAHAPRSHLAAVAFDAHVRSREDRRGEADECGERDEKHVQGVDEEELIQDQNRAVGNDS